jgi:hypothetical protein
MTTTTIDWQSAQRRLKLAIEMLTTRRICNGYAFDRGLGNEALADCRKERIDGVMRFSWRTGVPLDWLILGDTGALICAVVAASYSGRDATTDQSVVGGRVVLHPVT